jgi:hypothetical protein
MPMTAFDLAVVGGKNGHAQIDAGSETTIPGVDNRGAGT